MKLLKRTEGERQAYLEGFEAGKRAGICIGARGGVPSAEKRGKWVVDMSGLPMCTVCGEYLDEFQKQSKYCPNCGAKMESEE